MKYDPTDGYFKMFQLGQAAAMFEKKPKDKTARRKPKNTDLENVDIAELGMRLLKKKAQIDEAIKQFEKLTKKEEKKDDKKPEYFNVFQTSQILLLTSAVYVALHIATKGW